MSLFQPVKGELNKHSQIVVVKIEKPRTNVRGGEANQHSWSKKLVVTAQRRNQDHGNILCGFMANVDSAPGGGHSHERGVNDRRYDCGGNPTPEGSQRAGKSVLRPLRGRELSGGLRFAPTTG